MFDPLMFGFTMVISGCALSMCAETLRVLGMNRFVYITTYVVSAVLLIVGWLSMVASLMQTVRFT